MTDKEQPRKPSWSTCRTSGCIGIRLKNATACLTHVEPQAREAVLAALKPGADLDLRGTPIDPELLSDLLAAVRPEDGPPTLGNARFDSAKFTGYARFVQAIFGRDAAFRDAQFIGNAEFRGAQFHGDARFTRAHFFKDATFSEAKFTTDAGFKETRFTGDVGFRETHFAGLAEFNEAQFDGDARFLEAHLGGNAEFAKARFHGTAWFRDAQFTDSAEFRDAQFSGNAEFWEAQFSESADFATARFRGAAEFREAQFSKSAWFDHAQFTKSARFDRAQFNGLAGFREVQFTGNADFTKVQIIGDALFNEAKFTGDALFNEAKFTGLAQFFGTRFSGKARFWRTQFKRAGSLGPVFAASSLVLDRAVFEGDILIQLDGSTLVCTASRFTEPAKLQLRHAQVVLDDTVFAKPSTVAFASDPWKGAGPGSGTKVESFGEDLMVPNGGVRSPRPRLLSLRGVDVATLTLSELDLAACLFQGAHHLDQLRIEGARPFADTPAAWRLHVGPWSMPVWRRWSRRQALAEEHHWRGDPSEPRPTRWLDLTRPAWHGPICQTPPLVEDSTWQQPQTLMPDRLAVLYRALRKAQEDSKNEPGAADFYYGEMEMRRHDQNTPWAERLILWLYWLVAGYGLRGLRSLACLLAVVLGLAGLLQAIGFDDGDPTFRDALIYASQSTISIPTGNNALTDHVSWAGEVLRIVLRLVGPVLLGLALLSVRNRVKR